MSSSIGPARAALYSLLTAAAAEDGNPLQGVQVTFGPPDQYEEQEIVALLGITAEAEVSKLLGAQAARDEDYQIELAVKTYDPAGDAQSVDTRGWAMAEAARAVVNANRTLTGTVMWAYPASQRSDGSFPPVDEAGKRVPGWVCRVDMSIVCHARV